MIGPFLLSVFLEQPIETGIGRQRDDLKIDQAGPDQRQRIQRLPRLTRVAALQDQDRLMPIGPKVDFPQNIALL